MNHESAINVRDKLIVQQMTSPVISAVGFADLAM